MMEYMFYFILGFIFFCLVIIITSIDIVNSIEKNKIDSDLMNALLDMYGTKEKIISGITKSANVHAFFIIVAIISLNLYF